jgi:hypothetical protein
LERARRYTLIHEIVLGEELGAGTQRVVFTAVDNTEGAWTALKVTLASHRSDANGRSTVGSWICASRTSLGLPCPDCAEFRAFGIDLLDVSPGNIAFFK